eukprot:tig00020912_g15861.t1
MEVPAEKLRALDARMTLGGSGDSNGGFEDVVGLVSVLSPAGATPLDVQFRVEHRPPGDDDEEDSSSSLEEQNVEALETPAPANRDPKEVSPVIPKQERGGENSNDGVTPRKRKMFTRDEDERILQGVTKYGKQSWDEIVRWSGLSRTVDQVRKRYKRLEKKQEKERQAGAAGGVPATGAVPANTSPLRPLPEAANTPPATHPTASVGGVSPVPAVGLAPQLDAASSAPAAPSIPPSKPTRTLDHYFGRPAGAADERSRTSGAGSSAPRAQASRPARTSDASEPPAPPAFVDLEAREREGSLAAEVARLQQELRERDARLARFEADARSAAGLAAHVAALEKELAEAQRKQAEQETTVRAAMEEALRKAARYERREARESMLREGVRLGRLAYQRTGTGAQEVWEEGSAFRELQERVEKLNEEKECLERAKKALTRKRLPPPGEAAAPPGPDGSAPPSAEDLAEAEEFTKVRLLAIRSEIQYLIEEKDRLEREKALAVREARRQRDEDASRWSNHPLLHQRYLLLKLLGRGGFSQVFLAYDLKELRHVACKIHELAQHWSEEKKHNYIKHATREYNIHRSLCHPRVVQLFDVFEIDNNSFCTVLEHCDGGDLDLYLKNQKTLPEREARCIIHQVFSGLKYLNSQKKKIIHYDLKPGNILFHKGEAKITDFGLSKILEDGQESLDLTSQGAGTYWYLPPECFMNGAPRISSKVDVWSAGVILYQMLYGRKPFGHDQSQERILTEQTILKAQGVEFPAKPATTDACKDFIRRCLTRRQDERPDVFQVFNEPFLRQTPDAARGGKRARRRRRRPARRPRARRPPCPPSRVWRPPGPPPPS